MTQPTAMLSYGPPARSGARWVWVILAGVGTTALTLGISWAAEHYTKGDFTIMGLYGYGILPVGAFLVGLGAATGYAGAALVTGTRIRRGLLVAVLAITVVAYFAMHVVEFEAMGPLVHRGTNAPVTFLEYYDLKTRTMRFVSTNHTTPPPVHFGNGPQPGAPDDPAKDELGGLGYGIRALELLAFSAGALCLPIGLRGRTYCDLCERYHKVQKLATVPAAAKVGRFKLTAAAKAKLQDEHRSAADAADAVMRELTDAVAANDAEATRRVLEPLRAGSKEANKRLRRIEVRLSRCPQCGHGTLSPELVTMSANQRNVTRNKIWSAPVEPAFGDALRPR